MLGTHRLHWSIKEEVVNQVTAAQEGQLVAAEQSVQPIVGQFGHQA